MMVDKPNRDPDQREKLRQKAQELGRLIAQTAEYRYLQAAQRDIGDDREATELLNRAKKLQQQVISHIERGEDPPEEAREELEEVQSELQSSPRYQSVVSAQANFDKLMNRVHRAIGEGMKKGEESQIILPS